MARQKLEARFRGESVTLYKGQETCRVWPSQVKQMEEDGWSTSPKGSEAKGGSDGSQQQQQGDEVDQAGRDGEAGAEPGQQSQRQQQQQGRSGNQPSGGQRR